jgi:prolyl-tRNA editing enzyme YbaK/EbsC (Cys-tRNA(Pro) deacylase)
MEVVLQEETHDMDAIHLFPEEGSMECIYIEPDISENDIAMVIFQEGLFVRDPCVIRYNDLSKHRRLESRQSRILNIVRWLIGLSRLSPSRDASDKDSIASTTAESTESFDGGSSGGFEEPSLMETRLLSYPNIEESDFELQVDHVSKEVLHPGEEPDHDDEWKTHVKTGVWQVTICGEEPFYVVTGVRMSDHVDTKILRKIVLNGKTYSRRPKLTMAPTSIAEKLTGYKSGTMAPICHSVSMKLYFDESIVNKIAGYDDACPYHRIYVGSGMPGKCLSISFKKFWSIAQSNPMGAEIVALTKPGKRGK